jgi:electron transfer flavoprotein alpha subunit
MTDILVFCAASEEVLPQVSLEALAAANALSDDLNDSKVKAVLLGPDVEAHSETLVHQGADEVFVASYPEFQNHEGDVVLGAMEQVVAQLSPDVMIFPHDSLSGGHVAPRLAHRLGTGVITDCTDFEVKDGAIRWLRPVYGGKAMAYMVASGPVQMATMRSLAFEPLTPDPTREGAVQALEIDLDAIDVEIPIVDQIVEEAEYEGLSLDKADVIVSGGRGMEDEENFAVLRKLANALGAAVGGSRPAADLGWVPHSHLIGQTGKIVAPQLYIAVAISGAPQHMSGAGSAKTIVAINKDEDAPIFKAAHVGVVDEWENVVPSLIEAFEEAV